MSAAFLYSLGAVLLVSSVSLVGLFALLFKESFLRRAIFVLISLAVGALFGDAFIHLIPASFQESANGTLTSLLILAGIFAFFLLEKFLHWHHEHGYKSAAEYEEYKHDHHGHAVHPLGKLVLISDSFHNFLDGVIIAASFLVNTEIGIATTIAVVLHEIPHEIGDFGVLLHSGYTKSRALFLNFISALAAVAGALAVFAVGADIKSVGSAVVPFAAGGFVYIAADLLPELHKITRARDSLAQFAGLLLGIGFMLVILLIE